MPYNPRDYVPSYAGVRQGVNTAVSGLASGIGKLEDYSTARKKVVSDTRQMNELMQTARTTFTQELTSAGFAKDKADQLVAQSFPAIKEGDDTELVMKRIEFAAKKLSGMAKNKTEVQRPQQVAGFTQTAQQGLSESQLAQGRQGLTPEQLAEQSFQQRELLAAAPGAGQQRLAQRAGLAAQAEGAPQPTTKELQQVPEFATAETTAQGLARKKEERLERQSTARDEREHRRLSLREKTVAIQEWRAAIDSKKLRLKQTQELKKATSDYTSQIDDLGWLIDDAKDQIEQAKLTNNNLLKRQMETNIKEWEPELADAESEQKIVDELIKIRRTTREKDEIEKANLEVKKKDLAKKRGQAGLSGGSKYKVTKVEQK